MDASMRESELCRKNTPPIHTPWQGTVLILSRARVYENNRDENISFAIEPFADFKTNIARALQFHCLLRWID